MGVKHPYKNSTPNAYIGVGVKKVYEIREHYRRAKPIIQKHASLNGAWRAGIGDHRNWYAKEKDEKRLWDLSNDSDYNKLKESHRTLYWTLNFFEASEVDEEEKKEVPEVVVPEAVEKDLNEIDAIFNRCLVKARNTVRNAKFEEPGSTTILEIAGLYLKIYYDEKGGKERE